MIPKSFDPVTSREMVGDERSRALEAKARTDADAGTYDPPPYAEGISYWGYCQAEFARRVYFEQFQKRRARIERKAQQ